MGIEDASVPASGSVTQFFGRLQTGDPAPSGFNYCAYPNGQNPPCNRNSPAFNAARSFHAGGVNPLVADGSTKFFKNTINLSTWLALSSMSSGEVISADSY